MRPVIPIAVLAAAAAAAGLVLAQSPAAQRPVMHEELPLLAPDPAKNGAIIRKDSTGEPTAMVVGDKVVPMPQLGAQKKPDEPVLGTGVNQTGGQSSAGMDRQTELKPDMNTGPDSTLHYAGVFNPDVLPFKRMTSLDAIRDDYRMYVSRTILTELPVGGTHDERTHDRFVGDVRIKLSPGVDVALPSVAPDMRILHYKVHPKTTVKFLKDGADNFYVRTDDKNANGEFQLIFTVDADSRYFAPSLPANKYTVEEVARRAPPEYVPQIPEQVLEQARKTLKKSKIDIDRNYPLDIAFNRLVSYFRAFEAGDIKNPTGDTYRDLCDSQSGVCRHRSFAFMVTANAVGIPTRYVQNEAHAFVEVWFPERGWQRIDLGGAALRMDVANMSDKEIHRPRADDPFAKPPEYSNQYTQLDGDIRGLSQKQIADKKKSLDQAPSSGAVATGARKGSDQSGSGAGSGGKTGEQKLGPGSAGDPTDVADNPFGTDRITPDPTAPVKEQDPTKPTPELLVTTADTSAFRGDALHVEGSARARGKGIPNHRVDVYLAPQGLGGQGSKAIGYAITGPDGTFKVDLQVPSNLDLAKYEIRLATSDDATYNPALSD